MADRNKPLAGTLADEAIGGVAGLIEDLLGDGVGKALMYGLGGLAAFVVCALLVMAGELSRPLAASAWGLMGALFIAAAWVECPHEVRLPFAVTVDGEPAVRYPLSRGRFVCYVLAGLTLAQITVWLGITPLRAAIGRGHPRGWEYLQLPLGFLLLLFGLGGAAVCIPYLFWRRPRVDLTSTRLIIDVPPLRRTFNWNRIDHITFDAYKSHPGSKYGLKAPEIIVAPSVPQPLFGGRIGRAEARRVRRWRQAEIPTKMLLVDPEVTLRHLQYFLRNAAARGSLAAPETVRWLQDEMNLGVYERRLRELPEAAYDHAGRATSLLALGRTADALTAARRAVDLDPDEFLAHETLVEALLTTGQLDDAVNAAEHAARRWPDNPRLLIMYVEALLLVGRAQDATMQLRRHRPVTGRYVGDHDAETNLGVLLHQHGKLAEAEQWYRRAADAGHHDAETNLGVLLHQHGKLAEAERWYRRAADAGDEDAIGALARLLEERRR